MGLDYYPFGMTMPGRNWISSVGGYRYSHNGHEKENEIFEGAQSAEFWMYDSRLGRRWEMDPLAYEYQSPYAAFNNNPIVYADPLGLEGGDKGKGTAKEPVQLDGVEVSASGWDGQLPTINVSLSSSTTEAEIKTGNTQSSYSDVPIKTVNYHEAYPNSLRASDFSAGFRSALTHNGTLGMIPLKSGSDYSSDPMRQSIFLNGQMAGHVASVAGAEAGAGFATGLIGAGATEAVAASETGVGALPGLLGIAVGTAAEAGAVTVIAVATAGMAQTATEIHHMNSHNGGGEPNTSGEAQGSNMKSENIGANSRRLTETEIGEIFGDPNWHKTKLKEKLLKAYYKQLKGSTNFDFYIDKTSKEILLKGNKTGAWVQTGMFNN